MAKEGPLTHAQALLTRQKGFTTCVYHVLGKATVGGWGSMNGSGRFASAWVRLGRRRWIGSCTIWVGSRLRIPWDG